MTAQASDILVYGGERMALFANPLEQYLDQHPNRRPKAVATFGDISRISTSTGNYRGYVATWSILDDQLVLEDISVSVPASLESVMETITDITISGVPTGAALSTGTDNGDGTWTLTPADLAGADLARLTVTPPADSDVDFTLDVEVETLTSISSLAFPITGVADQPTVTVADAIGAEDSAIPLDITAVLMDEVSVSIDLGSVIPDATTPILANWFTGELRVPQGEMTQYIHAGYASEFERYLVFQVVEGRITETKIAKGGDHLSRDRGSARFWVWPMPITRLLALAIVLGPPLALIALLTNSAF